MSAASQRPLLASVVLAGAIGAVLPGVAHAQPAPSFRATCGALRAALDRLPADEETLVTIQVVAPLTLVRSDDVLVYMGACAPPDPRVLCVTYAEDGRRLGDQVILSGALSRRGPDHVLLDPCLHHAPDEPGSPR